jgi:HSP20 family protein
MNILPPRGPRPSTSFRTDLEHLFHHLPFAETASRLPAVFGRGPLPPVDVAETEKTWCVSVILPGLREKDIQVRITGEQLIVSGERNWEAEEKRKEYVSVESQFGAFERSIRLPGNVRLDPESITATYKRGILEVTLQKLEPTPSAKIPVKST